MLPFFVTTYMDSQQERIIDLEKVVKFQRELRDIELIFHKRHVEALKRSNAGLRKENKKLRKRDKEHKTHITRMQAKLQNNGRDMLFKNIVQWFDEARKVRDAA